MSLTSEQTEQLIELSAPLVAHPLPWAELSPEQQEAFLWLMPAESIGFTPEQRSWLGLWWLPTTEGELADLNALLPPTTRLAAREDTEGALWLSADLLSAALAEAAPWAALRPALTALPLTYKAAESWPIPQEEDES